VGLFSTDPGHNTGTPDRWIKITVHHETMHPAGCRVLTSFAMDDNTKQPVLLQTTQTVLLNCIKKHSIENFQIIHN